MNDNAYLHENECIQTSPNGFSQISRVDSCDLHTKVPCFLLAHPQLLLCKGNIEVISATENICRSQRKKVRTKL